MFHPVYFTSCIPPLTHSLSESSGVRVSEIDAHLADAAESLAHCLADVSRRRRVAAAALSERVEAVLRGLAMGQARFEAVIGWVSE